MSFEKQNNNVQGQIYKAKHIFTPIGGYYPSNIFHKMHVFENWGISPGE